jgi:hypothetical protein
MYHINKRIAITKLLRYNFLEHFGASDMARPRKGKELGFDAMMSFRIPTDLKAELQSAADEDCRSLSGELVFAVKTFLEARAAEKRNAKRASKYSK